MAQMIELHPRPDALHGLGLPAIPYPVALSTFQAAVANDGELPLADMLHGLQLRAAVPDAKWRPLVPAMVRLAELLAVEDDAAVAIATGDDWWLEIGPIDLRGPLVALRRGDVLVAVVADRGDSRLRVATWQPLDARTADLLMDFGAATHPAPGRGERHAPSSPWERARAAADADAGDPGADGVPALAWHPQGLVIAPGNDVSGPRRPAHVIAEFNVRCALAEPLR